MLKIKSFSIERKPAVAGQFYPSGKDLLSSSIDEFMENARVGGRVSDAKAYVAPHAGYSYSGQIAAFTYNALSMKKGLDKVDTFVMIGPNHTGLGYPISISGCDWRTPLGTVKNDVELAEGIAAQSDLFEMDESAHKLEHSLEVQLPFLQKSVDNPRCCFVCMGDQSFEYCTALSQAILKSAQKMERNIVVIASSDFNHYESAKIAHAKDTKAIEKLRTLDMEGFHHCIEKLGNSCCGYGPITVAGLFAKSKGARSGIVLKYGNSADINKDYKSVVAYSSIIFI